jgi:hypothetical protein
MLFLYFTLGDRDSTYQVVDEPLVGKLSNS